MGLARYFLAALFPLFTAYATFAIFTFSEENGTVAVVGGFLKDKVLPSASGREALRTDYTGIKAIDDIFTLLGVFFAPVVDGSNPSLVLHSIAFGGAFGSAWVLVVLESWRAGNARKFLYPSIFGIAAQLRTYAVFAPLFLGLQLAASDISFKPTAKNIAVPSAVVKAIPAVFVLGYTVPSLAMLLPAPGTVTFDQKQILIALWQPWPAYVSLLLTIVSLTSSSSASTATPSQLRKSLRGAYTFALSNAAINHVAAWSISLATVAAPAIFSSEYLSSLHPSQVFVPPNPFSSPGPEGTFRVQSIGEGVHYFLQWDNVIGSSAVLLWAVIANVSAQRKVQGGETNWFGYAFKVANSLVLTGPVGTAVRLVWERDELVLEDEGLKNASKKAI